METFIGILAGKVGLAAGALGLGGILILAKRFLPGILAKRASAELVKLMDPQSSDPKERELIKAVVLALVRLAEYKIPDKGAGDVRYKAVADKLCSLVPILHGQEDRLKELIESAVEAMDEELKKVGNG